jgi:MFS family permease
MGRKNTIIVGDIIMVIMCDVNIFRSVQPLDSEQQCGSLTGTLTLVFVLRSDSSRVSVQLWSKLPVKLRLLNLLGYAIITFVFSDNREKYIGMAEAFSGIGLMIGPVISGFLYTYADYFWTFVVFGVILGLSCIFTLFVTPNSLNKSIQDEDGEIDEETAKKVTFSMFMINKRSAFAFISCSVICIFMSFTAPFLTEVLSDEKGIPEVYNGLILALPCLTYAISSTLVSYITGYFPRRLFIMFAFLLLALATFLMGPSEILGFPDNNAILITGLGLSGVA